jgi:hypothetical protein
MAISRADTLTTITKKTEYYSDFNTLFVKTPFGDDIARTTNEKSVNQSLKNLIKTNYGERLFQPHLGSNVYNSLFDIVGSGASGPEEEILMFNITNMIKYQEPRVSLIDIAVNSNLDSNILEITLTYALINNPDPTTLTVLLKRVR